ncbi:MAG: HD domain-containing protein [Magnetococcales bacterium]|nr:HD domain-containing protein [Magnetococcales bacterium]
MEKENEASAGNVEGMISPLGLIIAVVFVGCAVALFFGIEAKNGLVWAAVAVVFHLTASIPYRSWYRYFVLSLFWRPPPPEKLIDVLFEYANIARKDGILELEKHPATYPPLQNAKDNCVDGADPEFLEGILEHELEAITEEVRRVQRNSTFIIVTFMFLVGFSSTTKPVMDSETLFANSHWTLLLAISGFWNWWRLDLLRSRIKETHKLITIGMSGIQRGVNPRMLMEYLQGGQDFYWHESHEEEKENNKSVADAPTEEQIRAAVDRYLADNPVESIVDAEITLKDHEGQSYVYYFSDMKMLDDKSLHTLIRNTSDDVFLAALKGANPRIVRHMFANMSTRVAAMLIEDLEMVGDKIPEKDILDSQAHILNILSKLEAEGSIVVFGAVRGLRTFPGWESWEACRGFLIKVCPDKVERLEQAFSFAKRWHGDQKRPAGEPYTLHLLQVLDILIEGAHVWDTELMITGLLHDVVEDTGCTLEEVRTHFGERVAGLVAWLTKPERTAGESKDENKKRYLERLRQAPEDAIIIKLADRLSNVQFLETHPRLEFQEKYFHETIQNILPLTEGIPVFENWFLDWQEEFAEKLEKGK